MKILITNDDGINGKGLNPLIKQIDELTSDWKVIVPDRERSAVSQAITLKEPIRMKKVKKNIFKIDGTPTDCVYLTVLGAIDYSPDIIISGINRGPNLSEDIVYSGTVAAAIEGCLAKIKSFAISIDALKGKIYYDTGAKIASYFTKVLSQLDVPDGIFFNINVPNLPYNKIKGIKTTKLGSRKYLDKLIKRKDPTGDPYFWLSGDDVLWRDQKGTDYYEVKRGYVSVTPLHLDLTAYEFIPKLTKIFKKSSI